MAPSPPACPPLEQLLDEVPVGLLVTDASGTITSVNRTLCTWAGYSAAELIGLKKLQDLFNVGGRIFYQTHWLPILQIQGSISEVKFDLKRSDGGLLTVMLNAVRKGTGAAAYDVVSVIVAEERNKYERQLLLERKRSEALAEKEVRAQEVLQVAESQLRQAVRVGGLHLWSADETGTRRFEPSVAALLALDVAATVGEAEFLGAIHAKDREGEELSFRNALADPSVVHSWSFGIRDARGHDKILISSGQAFANASGAQQRFVGVLRDITELARKSAEAEDRALFAEQMMGIVSHDLRNPLAAITMGASAIGRDATLSARHAKVLDNINRSSRRARRLIDELLDFTLVRVGHGLTVAHKPANLHELVAQLVEELKLAFPANPISHTAHGSAGCKVDPDRIAQLLGNLVANAVTYGEPNGPIAVTSSREDCECVLTVHNRGEPVPPEMLERMFQPLIRGGTRDQSTRSVGLGLFIVKAIAAAHGGSVTVTSSREQGTTFRFVFAS
ncbi:PAS domain-containing sensor histidine kinase [Roseateles sp.]|uniref:sensor histidine kinase n=1 Tax=Roseateles sp. TaxID=1971397 RepID=UPI003263BB1C